MEHTSECQIDVIETDALEADVPGETFQRQLGKRLKALRRSQRLSQTDVASLIDMSRVSVGYIEQGRRAPSLQTLEGLARLYSMSVSQLVDVSELVDVGEPVQSKAV